MQTTTYNSPAWASHETIRLLQPGDIQVWRIDLPIAPAFFSACLAALSQEELARANRRRQSLDHQHAVAGRGALRLLLAANASIAAAAVPIAMGPNKKPQTSTIAFNTAHSGNIILIALQLHGNLGIDVERIDPSTPILDIAAKNFTPAEAAYLAALPDDPRRRTAFFDLWSRKESIVKADGRGLHLPLHSFEATPTVTIPRPFDSPNTFRIHSLPVGDAYAAALATDQLSAVPQCFLFPTHDPFGL